MSFQTVQASKLDADSQSTHEGDASLEELEGLITEDLLLSITNGEQEYSEFVMKSFTKIRELKITHQTLKTSRILSNLMIALARYWMYNPQDSGFCWFGCVLTWAYEFDSTNPEIDKFLYALQYKDEFDSDKIQQFIKIRIKEIPEEVMLCMKVKKSNALPYELHWQSDEERINFFQNKFKNDPRFQELRKKKGLTDEKFYQQFN